ncbi:E3 ubiquitin-protein ligase sina [Zootermopsis nevadensis]|uniref:RING-type E3 ubiquitin transferase n=1 Tax=Zootermopsis nevadensis TaxID=136037 RepID=A0A067R3S3_ZOONE|nr:E3 ubiquitin-protein ligase sina [Zootermopsis nevadensis]
MAPSLKELLEEVECPVCMEYMLPPIAMCMNGHSTCSTCREKLLTCPVCRCLFSKARSLLAENLVRKMRFPCRHSKRGCRKTFNFLCVRKHEDECGHRPIKCPFANVSTVQCPWVGKATSVKTHVRKMHYMPSSDFANITVYSQVPKFNQEYNEVEWLLPLFCMQDIFFMTIRVTENNAHFCLQHVGLRRKTPNYKYKVRIKNDDGPDNSVMYNAPKYTECEIEKIFKEKNCPVIKQEIWKKFLQEDGSLAYEVKIFQNS